jgi:G:T-mismatch repair DNA endonuclease (very short patch repair protein)
MPKSRKSYLEPKPRNRRLRDEAVQEELSRLAWKSLVVWECELSDLIRTEKGIVRFLRK